ncbi:efflux RND transporter periplasmic adaptor subunit [Leptospira sp. 201903070]|uniref:Efflux RND transporter periplasmic adaptor subunit n=1 Tax=Leptospira ainlahdjerensis TaxID=2810033 RepID=A0ABS2U5C2_9LEPT|nr:efflux RND transporter periplasmic adaptor subunit [Leptospira ainlahdjerensis]MBM9575571.1 efflux RND transporter periplasmic adaptor subunit [Leptospira ainlahdjerensis]
MKFSFRLTMSVLLILVLVWNCTKQKEIYYCPMHPTYTSDRPGTCPICNMDLVKKDHGDHEEHNSSSTPGSNTTDFPDSAKVSSASQKPNSPEVKNVLEDSFSNRELFLSSEKQQSIGIKTELVLRRDLTKKISAYSTVAYDPELYTALTEYKEMLRSREFFPDTGSSLSGQNLQIRLRQLGLSTDQIRLWTSGKRDPSELILGGKSGRAHIYSQIYESDFSSAHVGLKILFKTNVYPETTFRGTIRSIDTILDKNSRTLRLRSEVEDRQQKLKPQMFGDLEIQIPLKQTLSVPTSAILDTGTDKVVYVQTGPDRFLATQVKTGLSIGAWTEIKEGLKEGERVVSESTFLIDSEARIRFGSTLHNH